MAQRTQVAGWAAVAAAAAVLLFHVGSDARPPQQAERAERPVMVMTGPNSEIQTLRYRLARSQEVFDELWKEHMGERIDRAAQGWPLTPTVDWDGYSALLIFGGQHVNSNGYHVIEVIEEADAQVVRVRRATYQTMAMGDGEIDHGNPVHPWAMVLLPATRKTVVLEEDAQSMLGRPPVWKERAAFPGEIGQGRVVPGTGQR
ncbi:MAG: hypothetical protein KDA21_03765 [Phycisphaerales bacterium]|nr:hypothetical protein [Phycisphaerales bacterium]